MKPNRLHSDNAVQGLAWDEEGLKCRSILRKAKASTLCRSVIQRLSTIRDADIAPDGDYLLLLRLLRMKAQKESVPAYYAVPSLHGKKNGYGEMRHEGCFGDLVFSTSWSEDTPSEQGFWYNRKTSEVLAIQYNKHNTLFFHANVKPTFGIVDKDNGERWERLCFDNQPCGVGRYYDEWNELLYEGLCVNGFWEGFGVRYYPLPGNNGEPRVDTRGWWCHGAVLQWAERFTRREDRLQEGLVVAGRFVDTALSLEGSASLSNLHCFLRELVIADNGLQSAQQLDLDLCRYLEVVVVGSNACQQCASFTVAHLPRLRSITVGKNAFSQYSSRLELLLSEGEAILHQRRACVFRDLRALTHVAIGAGAFSDYALFTIENTPSLRSLQIGLASSGAKRVTPSCCFFYAGALRVEAMGSLERLAIGNYSFYHTSDISFSDLPLLQQLLIGSACFFRRLRGRGVLKMAALPSLSLLMFQDQSLASVRSMILSSNRGSAT